VTRVSSGGTSLRITIPKKIRAILDIGEEDFVGFYEEDGKIVLRKIE